MSDDYWTEEQEQAHYKALEQQSALRERAKQRELDKILDQQEEGVKFQAEVGESFQAELVKAGITQEDYNTLIQADPSILRDTVIEGQKVAIQRVVQKRERDSRGRYLPVDKGQPQRQTHQETAPHPQGGEGPRALQDKIDKGYNPTEDELVDAMGDIFK